MVNTIKSLIFSHTNFSIILAPLRVSCPICRVVVKNIYLDEHVRNVHEVHFTSCPECNKVFKSRKLMSTHLLSHRKDRYQCSHCAKTFSHPKALREHEAVHLGKSLYHCQFCSKGFKSSGNLNAHRRRLHPIEYATSKARRNIMKYQL